MDLVRRTSSSPRGLPDNYLEASSESRGYEAPALFFSSVASRFGEDFIAETAYKPASAAKGVARRQARVYRARHFL